MPRDLPHRNYYRAGTLGEGGFGAVVTLFDDDGAEFAGKKFDECEEDETCDIGTLREVSMLQMLSDEAHPSVIGLVDMCDIEGQLSMVIPKLPCNLADKIKEKSLNKQQKVAIAYELLKGLEYLHSKNVIHRDIKSENVMLDAHDKPIIIDFSLAKSLTHFCAAPADESEGRKKKAGKKRSKPPKGSGGGANGGLYQNLTDEVGAGGC
jgi:serine/threonine protein kinase